MIARIAGISGPAIIREGTAGESRGYLRQTDERRINCRSSGAAGDEVNPSGDSSDFRGEVTVGIRGGPPEHVGTPLLTGPNTTTSVSLFFFPVMRVAWRY